MHPAPSIIVFTVASGLGLGLLALLGLGLITPQGFGAFLWFGAAYGLTLAGLAASTYHLGRPERALKAFSQWRSSWLSREAVLVAACLALMTPHAAALVFFTRPLPVLAAVAGVLALQTILATSMIYAQLRTVPRWNHWSTPAVFLIAALAGATMMTGMVPLAQVLLAWLALAMVAHWLLGDRRFAASGVTLGTATGLGALGTPRPFEPPHTGRSYLLTEMVHVVARAHAIKLRVVAMVLACVLPSLILLGLPPRWPVISLAMASHLTGMLAARWLFFAEAEHTLSLYYGRPPTR